MSSNQSASAVMASSLLPGIELGFPEFRECVPHYMLPVLEVRQAVQAALRARGAALSGLRLGYPVVSLPGDARRGLEVCWELALRLATELEPVAWYNRECRPLVVA